jgi:RimJ/RimL family protein N-acetyltransferase
MPFLPGETVDLEPLDPRDDAHVACYRETRNRPEMRATGGYEAGLTTAEARAAIEERREREGACCAIVAEGGVQGWAEVHLRDRRAGEAEVSYYVRPGGQGKGYATEAVGLLVGYAVDGLNANSVVGRIRADNEASRRVLEKVGFIHEGTRREGVYTAGSHHDVAIYGLLAAEYRRLGEDDDGEDEGEGEGEAVHE